MPMSYELAVLCCFCGKPATPRPRVMTVELDGGGQQRLFAHEACLRERLDPSVRLGEAGTSGVELTHRTRGWSLRRVMVVGMLAALVLLIPTLVILFVGRR
jgi:hypothetical protein